MEVRSWQPAPALPLRDLLIVENHIYLREPGQVDPDGIAVALVDVVQVQPWLPAQVEAALSSGWVPGYYAWQLSNVRPLNGRLCVSAERGLYEVELLKPLT